MSMRTICGTLIATTWMTATATTADAALGLHLQAFGPSEEREALVTTLDPDWESETRLGGHLGYLHGTPGSNDPDPANVPNVYGGPSWCALSAPSPCATGHVRVFGSVDGATGSMQLFSRAETPAAGLFNGWINATLDDRITLPAPSAGLTIRLTLGGRHEQIVDLPETSFPGSDFFYSLTLRRPDSAAPPGCDGGAGAPPCDVTFVEIIFTSEIDPLLGTRLWSWSAVGFDDDGVQNVTGGASGQGSGATFQVFMPNPHQLMELAISGEAQSDCVRTAGGNCRVRLDASHGAHVSFLGGYSSENGYVYAPEASGAGAWLAAVTSLAAIARRRRPGRDARRTIFGGRASGSGPSGSGKEARRRKSRALR